MLFIAPTPTKTSLKKKAAVVTKAQQLRRIFEEKHSPGIDRTSLLFACVRQSRLGAKSLLLADLSGFSFSIAFSTAALLSTRVTFSSVSPSTSTRIFTKIFTRV